ncbi:Pre-mRNA-processing factor 39 [Hordeum vulgare]|nr:Pre-mRNA-processing factor 39 [Hordeum vulgare]
MATDLRESGEEERSNEEGAAAYQARMAEAIALSVVGDCIVPPLAPPSPARLEPARNVLKPHEYIWEGVVREWVSAPPVWMRATLEQEQIYLKQWQQQHLRAEHEDDDQSDVFA